jgi:hypothetical protein
MLPANRAERMSEIRSGAIWSTRIVVMIRDRPELPW